MDHGERITLTLLTRRTLCIDWVNTIAWRGSTPTESLHGLGDVIDWLVANGALAADAATEIKRIMSSTHQAKMEALFAMTLSLRESLYEFLRSLANDAPLAAAHVESLDALLNHHPARQRMAYSPIGAGWGITAHLGATAILAPVLWSAADLLVTGDYKRLRECANSRCLWLFLDDSKSGTRRWCSMQACGNRAKAHRHYQRKKSL